MPLKDDLAAQIKESFDALWDFEETEKVPEPEDLVLNANHAKYLGVATVLYADIDGSTGMVDARPWWFSAEIYKAYLRCASALIRSEGGAITAYDGDRVMAVFTGPQSNTCAVRCALKINWAALQILQPAIAAYKFGHSDFVFKHKVGVDTSQLFAARIGVRGDNDLVWIGRAANHAAKLTAIPVDPNIWITKDVYDNIDQSVKVHDGKNMWTARKWTQMNDVDIYCSTYWHTFLD